MTTKTTKQNVDIYAAVEAITNVRSDGIEYYNWGSNEVYVMPTEWIDGDGI